MMINFRDAISEFEFQRDLNGMIILHVLSIFFGKCIQNGLSKYTFIINDQTGTIFTVFPNELSNYTLEIIFSIGRVA